MSGTTQAFGARERVPVALSMERQMIVDSVRKICNRYDRKYWLECARRGEFTAELWDELAHGGFVGFSVPESLGGSGGGMTEHVMVMEEMARHGVPLMLLIVNGLSRIPILRYGSAEMKERVMAGSATGGIKIGFGITEPDAGTNTFRIRTMATRQPDSRYVIRGQKIWTSGFDVADCILLVTRTTPYDGEKDRKDGLSLFLVDTNLPGITSEPIEIGIVLPERTYVVHYDDVVVEGSALVGEEGHGAEYLFDGLNPERMIVAGMAVGLGHYAVQRAVEYANSRRVFDQPIGAHQAIQHPLAKVTAKLEAARQLLYVATEHFDAGQPAATEANMAKLLASEAAVEAADIAIQVHGGYGFAVDYDVISLWPLARLLSVAPINNEMVLNYIGQHVLGLPRSY